VRITAPPDSDALRRGPRLLARGRLTIALVILATLIRLGLLVSRLDSGTGVFHPLPDPQCEANGFTPPEAREGICARYEDGHVVIYNVVDRAHTLHMPEYDAHLLVERITHTRVTNWKENPDLYPEGRGRLVSLEVEILNTSSTPLQIGPLVIRSSTPSYHPNPPTEILLPRSHETTEVIGYPDVYNGRGAPAPSLLGQPPIQPATRLVGWITVVAPWNAETLVAQPGADLDLSPVDGNPGYVGQIRLWK
jgi:hypothetical protein